MKVRALSILAALALLVSFPVIAQTPEYTPPAEETAAPAAEETAAPAEESTMEEPAADVTAEAEADVDVDTEADADLEGEGELPATASPLALLALLGLGGASSAVGLRFARRR